MTNRNKSMKKDGMIKKKTRERERVLTILSYVS